MEKELTQTPPTLVKEGLHNTQQIINLDYLKDLTKNNGAIMSQIIETYLKDTPILINTIKQAIDNQDWESLRIAAHSIKPTFATMGINKDYEFMANQIQEYATELQTEDFPEQARVSVRHSGTLDNTKMIKLINEWYFKIERVCSQAYEELKKELSKLK